MQITLQNRQIREKKVGHVIVHVEVALVYPMILHYQTD